MGLSNWESNPATGGSLGLKQGLEFAWGKEKRYHREGKFLSGDKEPSD